MKTVVLKIDAQKPDKKKVQQAAEVLRSGGVIAFPTDTVYGLAASAFITGARERIYALKGRSYHKPLILMPPDAEALGCLAEVDARAARLMERFWPGPLTLVLRTTALGRMVMGGRGDLGARIPDSPVARELLKACGFPLLTTSANPSSKPSAASGREAEQYFAGSLDLVLDAGPAPIGKASTVIDMTHFHCVVVREGCLDSKTLLEYL